MQENIVMRFTNTGIGQLQKIERENNERLRRDIEKAEIGLDMLKAELLASNAKLRQYARVQRERGE